MAANGTPGVGAATEQMGDPLNKTTASSLGELMPFGLLLAHDTVQGFQGICDDGSGM